MSLTVPQLARILATGGLVLAWAVAAHEGSVGRGNPDFNALVAAAPLAAALGLAGRRGRYRHVALLGLTAFLGAQAAWWPQVRNNVAFLYLIQHVGVNLALATFFGRSLTGPGDALVTRLARLAETPDLSPRKEHYTRQVTAAWAAFFVANAAVSALLYALAPAEAWSVYANILGGPLVALMFLAEHLCRRRVLPPDERPSFATVVRAWRNHRSTPAA